MSPFSVTTAVRATCSAAAAARRARHEGDRAAHVPVLVLDGALVLQRQPVPLALERGVAAEPEVGHEAGHHPVEAAPREEAAAHQLAEALRRERRKPAVHLKDYFETYFHGLTPEDKLDYLDLRESEIHDSLKMDILS